MARHVVSCHVMSHVYTAKQTKQMRIPFDPESLSKKHFMPYIAATIVANKMLICPAVKGGEFVLELVLGEQAFDLRSCNTSTRGRKPTEASSETSGFAACVVRT